MDKLLEMTQKYPQTHYWNDSCSVQELNYAISRGACGATTNPVIVKNVLEKELDHYREYIESEIKDHSWACEDDIAWIVMEKMATDGAKLLYPIFNPSTGAGRLSIQVNAKNYNNPLLMTEQAVHFLDIAPNIQVKIPTTSAGLIAIEESTYQGVSINATVSFSATQAIAAAEAVERGLEKRKSEGFSVDGITPVITIMVGRLDDWLKYSVERDGLDIDKNALDWAGIACAKKAYRIFKEKGYSSRLLIAAYRHEKHWTQFIGGDLSMTIPYKNQVAFNNSDAVIESHIDDEIPSEYMDALMTIPDFVYAYEHMDSNKFDSYGAVNKTLQQFLSGYDSLIGIIRSFMIKY